MNHTQTNNPKEVTEFFLFLLTAQKYSCSTTAWLVDLMRGARDKLVWAIWPSCRIRCNYTFWVRPP